MMRAIWLLAPFPLFLLLPLMMTLLSIRHLYSTSHWRIVGIYKVMSGLNSRGGNSIHLRMFFNCCCVHWTFSQCAWQRQEGASYNFFLVLIGICFAHSSHIPVILRHNPTSRRHRDHPQIKLSRNAEKKKRDRERRTIYYRSKPPKAELDRLTV